MSKPNPEATREGSLEAPTRHPLDWQRPDFYDEGALFGELERVFDICHGCRRCFSLCNAFPSLFDLIDESESMELDGVQKSDFWKVVDHCYLCDMCYMTKCPYVPPHPWNVDFPHLMLRAKAVKKRRGDITVRDRMLSSTDTLGRLVSNPVIAQSVNSANRSGGLRMALEKILGVHHGARLPEYQPQTLRRRDRIRRPLEIEPETTPSTRGRVALFATCYGNFNDPSLGQDLIAVFEHNRIPVMLAERERCCGMPKLELGDLEAVARAKSDNIPVLADLIDRGWDIVAPIPSCVLMFKQELPLMFPEDPAVLKVRDGIYDPYEYLMLRHRDGKLRTDFKVPLGKIAYHVACHQRVQNLGLKTRDILSLVPETEVVPIERCSGHDGTYAVKREFHEVSMKIVKPVAERVRAAKADHYTSDCAMAANHIANGLNDGSKPENPMSLLRRAYGI